MEDSLTRSGIAYNINLSPHKLDVSYGENVITYTFSSDLYKTKFLEKIEKNRKTINESLSKRFGYEISNNVLADIRLYKSTEKRGFLIETKEERYECLNNIRLDGHHLMNKS